MEDLELTELKALNLVYNITSGQPVYIALFSDLHIDSNSCQKKKLIEHLNFCKDIGASIFILGDVFDAILLKDFKRATNSRVEQDDAQLNVKMKKVVELLKPFADNIEIISKGNHEISVAKYSGVDLIEWLIDELNRFKTNGEIKYGGFQTWIQIGLKYQKDKYSRINYDIFGMHGVGGNAPVTKGMIDFNRIANGVDADLIWTGHKHNNIQDNSIPIRRIKNGVVTIKNRKAVQTPSYTAQLHNPKNINFEDNFPNVQAESGFGLLTLIAKKTHNDLELKSNVRVINDIEFELLYQKSR